MIIKNADVYTEDGKFQRKDIYAEGGRFVASLKQVQDQTVVDAEGCYAIPGLIDIHFHGCAGYDLCDKTGKALAAMAEYEASVGVTGILPATMTLAEDTLIGAAKAVRGYSGKEPKNRSGARARLWGIHLEGPFLSQEKKGAQNGRYIRKPDAELFDRIQQASGEMVRMITLAPETEGAMEFIEKKHAETVISLGHTQADYETAMLAFEKGASHVTHLYNAMPPYTHRAPGLVGAAADAEKVGVELICDGVHVHPAAVRTTFKIFGDDRIIFISDSMMATGLGDGDYTLGGQPVRVTGNHAVLKDGTIAGSVTNLMDCVRIAVKMGIPLESAVKCATINPAKSIGVYECCGSITPGKYADVVLLRKDDLAVREVLLGGEERGRAN